MRSPSPESGSYDSGEGVGGEAGEAFAA